MSDKRGLEVALNSLRKVIDDLASSDSAAQPDLSLSLLEKLSSIADSLSAYQDEVAAEARLGPARGPAARRGTRGSGEGPEWKYVGIRRLAVSIEDSVYRGTQWAVFEPNNEALWSRIRSSVEGLMQGLFQRGEFKGTKPEQGYFVKCGIETTTQADIDRGVVNILVGYAPLKSAEFVILRIQQGAGRHKPRHRRG
jgi:phage tail sheath protein FI